MVLESNRDLVLRRLVECLGRDRTRHQVAEVTSLGLVQMTRKRIGTGLLEAFSHDCEHCKGRGVVVARPPGRAGRPVRRRRAARATVGPRWTQPRRSRTASGGNQGGNGGNGGGGGTARARHRRTSPAPAPPGEAGRDEPPDAAAEAAAEPGGAGRAGRTGRPAPEPSSPIGTSRPRRTAEPTRHRRAGRATGAADAEACTETAPAQHRDGRWPTRGAAGGHQHPSSYGARARPVRRPPSPRPRRVGGAGTRAAPVAEPVDIPVEPAVTGSRAGPTPGPTVRLADPDAEPDAEADDTGREPRGRRHATATGSRCCTCRSSARDPASADGRLDRPGARSVLTLPPASQ